MGSDLVHNNHDLFVVVQYAGSVLFCLSWCRVCTVRVCPVFLLWIFLETPLELLLVCVCVRGCVSACTLHSVSHFLHILPTYPPTLTTGPHIHKTGGADKTAIVFHKDSKQIVATLKGHTKKVSGAVYHPREVNSVTNVTKLPIHHVLNEAIGWEPMESSKENTLEVVCPWEMPIAVKLLSRALLISEAFYFRLSSYVSSCEFLLAYSTEL